MDDKQLNSITSQVSRKFPEVANAKPQVKRQSGQNAKSSPATYLITYRGKSKTADGKSITRIGLPRMKSRTGPDTSAVVANMPLE
jgi:hypothetical protein